MPPLSLEERVATLEREVAGLKALNGEPHKNDWRRTVGMFTDDPFMLEVFAEAMKIREAGRKKTRRRGERRSVKA